mmetsp:Transcript_35293/g.65864  ORF Transcript_35293/g.65864 Transcript_35293/m.65864 type:complete len:383 (-) Transcript_35293:163-1311(-)
MSNSGSSVQNEEVEDSKESDRLIAHPLEVESAKAADSNSSNENKSLIGKGLFCFFGLQFSYLTWGMMQEIIMTTKFEPTTDVPSGYFPSASFCVLANRVVAILVAYTVCMYKYGTIDCGVPVWHFLPSAVSNTMSSWAQYKALNYVSFPLQNLFKSTKVIPVMGMGRLLRGVTYTLTEYLEAITITAGVVIFSMAKGGHGDTERNSVLGVILLLTYVSFDSFTSQYQTKLFKEHGKIDQYHMMFWINSWAIVLSFGAIVVSGEVSTVFFFLLANPSAFVYNLITAVTSATGQYFIFYTIKEFGPVVFTVIMTTRQLLSMIISSILFHHPLTVMSYLGGLLVFTAVFHSIRRQMIKRSLAEAEKAHLQTIIAEAESKDNTLKL